MSVTKIVGERLKLHRLEKSLSQEQLALMAGVSPAHIGRLERGQNNASLVSLEKVLNALEVSFEDFFKYIQASTKENENIVLPLIMNKLINMSIEDQQDIMTIIDTISHIKKSDK